MKSSQLFSVLVLLGSCCIAQAAPTVSIDDLSAETLKSAATPRQQASIKQYEDAKAKKEQDRKDALAKAKEVTKINDSGMKKTIQSRALNAMLPACERSPEAARTPNVYTVRGRR